MRIERVGDLRVNSALEELIAALPQELLPAQSREPGKIWERVVPAKSENMDPTVQQGWRLSVVRNCVFNISARANETKCSLEAVGEYILLAWGNIAIHLRDGLKVDAFKGKRAVIGDVHLCMRVFWPQGAEERSSNQRAWKNYLFYFDVFPASEECEPTTRLIFFKEDQDRADPLILDDRGEWAYRSPNFNSSRGTGCDQHFQFRRENPDIKIDVPEVSRPQTTNW